MLAIYHAVVHDDWANDRPAATPLRHDDAVTSEVSILERPVYNVGEAASLLGLRTDRARAWLDGYERAGTSYPPVIRAERSGDEIVTWGEFVELGNSSSTSKNGRVCRRQSPS